MEVYVRVPHVIFNEKSSLNATAVFRDGETANAPTTAKYRIDCLTTGTKIKDWTSLTPAASITIPITSTENKIQDQSYRFEKKQITVAADPDTSTETHGVTTYKIENTRGVN